MSRRALSAAGAVVGALVVLAVVLAAVLSGLGGNGSGPHRDAAPHSRGGASTSVSVTGSDRDPPSGVPWVDASDLPEEARDTLRLIDAGGPFPYPGKDSSTFGNLEGLLPEHPRGYYAEYTVPTPGSRDRGARRIITGDGGELYWTADHYQHFQRIRR